METIRFSIVSSVRDNRPVIVESSWSEFAGRFETPEIRGHLTLAEYRAVKEKDTRAAGRLKDGKAFAGAIFNGEGRSAKHVESLTAFGLDFDDGRISIEEVRECLNGYSYILHTSYGHTPDEARFRVILPLANPVTPDYATRLFSHFQKVFDGALDEACKNPDRLFFFPSCPPDAAEFYQYHIADGEPFDASTLPEPVKESKANKTTAQIIPFKQPVKKGRPSDIDRLVKEGAPVGQRSNAIARVVYAKLNAGYSDEEIVGVLMDESSGISGKSLERGELWTWAEVERLRGKWTAERNVSEAVLAELLGRFTFILHGASSLIAEELPDGEIAFRSYAALRDYYANQLIFLPHSKKPQNPVDLWLADRGRKSCTAMGFFPGQTPPGTFNLFRDWKVEPVPGDCGIFKAFVLQIICSGRKSVFYWLWAWLAHMFQQPNELPGTSVAVRSPPGCGKNFLIDTIGYLCGLHFYTAASTEELVGRFNSHLSSALLIHAEEALWAGDRAAEGTLKSLITNPRRSIEFKGKDRVTMANFCRVMFSSNEHWVVPRGVGDRRFLVLDVNEERRQDHEYFAGLQAWLDGGGYGHLLHDLLTFDLVGANVRKLPDENDGGDLKLRSLRSPAQFWFEALLDEQLPDFQPAECWQGTCWPIAPEIQKVFDCYIKWMAHRRGYLSDRAEFCAITEDLFGKLPTYRPALSSGERPRCWRLAHCETLREKFARVVGEPVEVLFPEGIA